MGNGRAGGAARQVIMLRMMETLTMFGTAMEGSRRARCVEEKVDGGVDEIYGGHDALEADASAVERGSTGDALGGPTSLMGASSVQAEVCEVGCDAHRC